MCENILLKASVLFYFLFSVFPAQGQAELELAKAKLLAQKPKEALTILWRTARDTAQIQDFYTVMAFAQAALIHPDSTWPATQLDSCHHYFRLAEQMPAAKLNQKSTRDLLLRLRIEKERVFRVAYNLLRSQPHEELAEKVVRFFPENEKALTLFLKQSTNDSLRFVYGLHKAHSYGLTYEEWPLLLRLSLQRSKDTVLTRRLLREATIYHPEKVSWAEDYAALAFAQKDTLGGVDFLWPRRSHFLMHFLEQKEAYYSLEKYLAALEDSSLKVQEKLAVVQLQQTRELLTRLKEDPENYTHFVPLALEHCRLVQKKLKPFKHFQSAAAALQKAEIQLEGLLKSKALKKNTRQTLPPQQVARGEEFEVKGKVVKVSGFLHFPDSTGKVTLRFYSPLPDTIQLHYFHSGESVTQQIILNSPKKEGAKTPDLVKETAIFYSLPHGQAPDSSVHALGKSLLKHFPAGKTHFTSLPDTIPQYAGRVIVIHFQDSLPTYPSWVFTGKVPLLFLGVKLPSFFAFKSMRKNMQSAWFYPQAFSACYGLQITDFTRFTESLEALPATKDPFQLYLLLKPHLPALQLYEAAFPQHTGGTF